ncbi:hypothetical protein BDD12DRAFT_805842 [Trichophaea hybrida]|nr:hypothetical protein BDD12DRAFT_805842 [Trichophaea hybrida]
MQNAAASKTTPLTGEARTSAPAASTSSTGAASHGIDDSHAKPGDSSIVPQKLQEALPEKVENSVPNTVHDTGSSGSKSHAKPDGSILPETIQQMVPETVERMVPNAIHDTGDKKAFGKK